MRALSAVAELRVVTGVAHFFLELQGCIRT